MKAMWLPSGETSILIIRGQCFHAVMVGEAMGRTGEGGHPLNPTVAIDVEILLVRESVGAVELLQRGKVDFAALGGDEAVGEAVATLMVFQLTVEQLVGGGDVAWVVMVPLLRLDYCHGRSRCCRHRPFPLEIRVSELVASLTTCRDRRWCRCLRARAVDRW